MYTASFTQNSYYNTHFIINQLSDTADCCQLMAIETLADDCPVVYLWITPERTNVCSFILPSIPYKQLLFDCNTLHFCFNDQVVATIHL